MLDFVAQHQADGVVGRIFLIDPWFEVEVADPACAWSLVQEDGKITWWGKPYPAVSRLRHKQLPIEVLIARCCTVSMFTKRLQRWQGVAEDETHPDLCSCGDGQDFHQYKERIQAAGGLVLHCICGCVDTTEYRLSSQRRIEPVMPAVANCERGEGREEADKEADSDEEAAQFEYLRLSQWNDKAQHMLATNLGGATCAASCSPPAAGLRETERPG